MSRNVKSIIEDFLAEGPFAVVGASTDPWKYGHKVFRCYLQHGRQAYPINPTASEVAGQAAFPDLESLPVTCPSLSVITPPPVTEQIVEVAAKVGVKRIWMQPGAESVKAIARAEELGMEVIAGGPCLLVVLGYHED